MKNKQPLIDMKLFYLLGAISFAIVALFNLFNLLAYPESYTLYTKIATGGNIFFNIVLVIFFLGMRGQLEGESISYVNSPRNDFEEASNAN